MNYESETKGHIVFLNSIVIFCHNLHDSPHFCTFLYSSSENLRNLNPLHICRPFMNLRGNIFSNTDLLILQLIYLYLNQVYFYKNTHNCLLKHSVIFFNLILFTILFWATGSAAQVGSCHVQLQWILSDVPK